MSVVGIDLGAQSTKIGVARNKGIDIVRVASLRLFFFFFFATFFFFLLILILSCPKEFALTFFLSILGLQ